MIQHVPETLVVGHIVPWSWYLEIDVTYLVHLTGGFIDFREC